MFLIIYWGIYCGNKNDNRITKTMVKHMGWKSNEKALGKKFRSLQGDERIVRVINNFHATSLHQAAGPFVLNIKEQSEVVYWFLKYE